MRVVALLATYNEQRFITACLDHLRSQGVSVYVIDNESTDNTVALAQPYVGKGVLGIETFPRDGVYRWKRILERKEQLAETLDGDWFIHLDADEIRLSPWPDRTLQEAISEIDSRGYNTINFFEYTFIPTQEFPDHDSPEFQATMRWYYPYKTNTVHGLKAWKRPAVSGRFRTAMSVLRLGRKPAELAWSGGHRVRFRGQRIYPESFPMRHYLFLSIPHAIEKYVDRKYDEKEVESGWHQWRAKINTDAMRLPSISELRTYSSDERLDPSNPRTRHYVAQWLS
jgi:glycosyltransferase involved in cell wall biosynthesis